MIDPTIRSAAPDDAEQLDLLEAEARAALASQRGGPRWLATHPSRGGRWAGVIGLDHVFVAHIGDVVVGYVVATVEAGVATIADVYVTPEARELGFGDQLLAAAIASAREVGAAHLEGEALPGDRDTKNLYERAGIKARLITVSTPLT
ncbi:MAG: GNAT family N-acetyltransferase [Ilumatobacter sp.]|uniref:GNAT family N-acetyltransferase n=1 Tax=Ilumatobacter sp. TaxID=1967498 RepID=UPI00262B1E8A|nr:GNAT family N-acetyltransferase [Ilumatobacter sp.]MDJ0771465.1 GNAT family N-acetyltransferase [Ilumatobacter sp.]